MDGSAFRGIDKLLYILIAGTVIVSMTIGYFIGKL